MKHDFSGACPKCQQIINAYPGFHKPLRIWFETLQSFHQEAHVSCAGRGRVDQETAFFRKASRAKFGESAHNYNAALDLFVLRDGDIYPKEWFDAVLAHALPAFIEWYGRPAYKNDPAKMWELPHVEIRNWRELKDHGLIGLVEDVHPLGPTVRL